MAVLTLEQGSSPLTSNSAWNFGVGLQGFHGSTGPSPTLYEPAHAFVVASEVCDLATVNAIVEDQNAQK